MWKPIALAAAMTAAAATTVTATGLPRLEIDTSITIAAPPSMVWAALADLDSYPDWNPYHVQVDGTPEPGSKLAVHIRKPNGKELTVRPRVRTADPGKSLVWGGGIKGVFLGEHRFDLTPVGNGCTLLSHSEVFEGVFVPMASLDAIGDGYQLMNEALKDHVEAKGATGQC